MSEIDDVINESIRRRAGEVRIGGGSIADVQQRVVRRRRKALSIACTALALPGLLAVGVVIGQRTASNNDMFSAAAAGGDTATADSTPSTDNVDPTPSTPTPSTIFADSCSVVTATTIDSAVDPYGEPTSVTFTPNTVPFTACDYSDASTTWICRGEIETSAAWTGWRSFSECRPAVINGDLTVTTTSVIP